MTMQSIAAGMQRMSAAFERRPGAALCDDAPATAHWERGTRVVTTHGHGTQVVTDMPVEFGGSGDNVTPGWLLRAGLASCAATRIAMGAATEGIALLTLEVRATSRSDARGLLGMAGARGERVPAGPSDVQLHVRIAAEGVSTQQLEALVADSHRCSAVAEALQCAVPVALHIEAESR